MKRIGIALALSWLLASDASFARSEAEPPVAVEERASTGARVLTLTGFLTLIGGLLVSWSRDTSCHEERSVYSRE